MIEFIRSWRRLRRRSGSLLVSVALVAGGTGAVVAAVTLTQRTILNPVSVPAGQEVVALGVTDRSSNIQVHSAHTFDVFQAVQSSGVFDHTAAAGFWPLAITARDVQRSLPVMFVTDGFFRLFDVACLGRCLAHVDTGDEDVPPAVISQWFARQAFQMSAPLGERLLVAGREVVVVGVAPEHFRGLEVGRAPAAFVPLRSIRTLRPRPSNYFAETTHESSPLGWLSILGSFAGGTSSDRLEGLKHTVRLWADSTPTLVTINDAAVPANLRHDLSRAILLLCTAAFLLWAIALTSVWMIEVARSELRMHEQFLRRALGASRLSVWTQGAVDAFWISALAGVIGVPTGVLLLRTLADQRLPGDIAVSTLQLSITGGSVAVAAAGLVVVALTLAMVGSSGLRRTDIGALATVRRRPQLRMVLVISQVSIAVALVAIASLLGRSLTTARGLNASVNTDRIVTFGVGLRNQRADVEEVFRRLQERLANAPGIDKVAMFAPLGSLGSLGSAVDLYVDGLPTRLGRPVDFVAVDDEYIALFRLRVPGPFVSRGLARSDQGWVSSSLAAHIRPGGDVIGHTIREPWRSHEKQFGEVSLAGIVGNLTTDVRNPNPYVVYQPLGARPDLKSRRFAVSGSGPLTGTVNTVLDTVRGNSDSLIVSEPHSLTDAMTSSMGAQRLGLLVVGIFGAMAVVMSIAGVAGLSEYLLRSRTREIAVRIALGSTRTGVQAVVLRELMISMVIGALIGVVVAITAGRAIQSLLFGVEPIDPISILLPFTVMLALGAGLGWNAALRAARISVVSALRSD